MGHDVYSFDGRRYWKSQQKWGWGWIFTQCHGAGVPTEKSMCTDFFGGGGDLIHDLFLLSLLFPSSFLLCLMHFFAQLFGWHPFNLGRVILPRQCGKINEKFTIFSDFGGLNCDSCMCWPADIHTTYSLRTVAFKCTKPLDVLTFTSTSRSLELDRKHDVCLACKRPRVRSPRPAHFFMETWSWKHFYGHSPSSPDSRRVGFSYWKIGEKFMIFSDFEGFYCASCMRWPADIDTTYSLCAVLLLYSYVLNH